MSPLANLLGAAGNTAPIGIAVVDGFEVVRVDGASKDTLFQAGSISKAVTALVGLELVAAGRLNLDADVNATLRAWRLPGERAIAMRDLLGHTAGVGVPFFPGYAQGEPLPTPVEVLDGVPPALTAPVRIESAPSSGFHYSGGGYVIVQQLVAEATENTFADAAEALVLKPLGMTRSTFQQPLPQPWRTLAARSDWRVYPETAAAGLWTTPSDLARLICAIQRARGGHASPTTRTAAALMLEPRVDLPPEGDWSQLPSLGVRPPDQYGLGVFLEGTDRFSHLGGAAGFFSILSASVHDGTGTVVMTASDPSPLAFEVLLAISDEYGWQGVRA
jgi:CubicO group peptidase (beta-lactamase class C family)